jgi:hypothetical protein
MLPGRPGRVIFGLLSAGRRFESCPAHRFRECRPYPHRRSPAETEPSGRLGMDTAHTERADAVSEYEDVIPRITREMLRSTDPLEVIDQPDALSEAIRVEAEFARPYLEARRQAERLAALQKKLGRICRIPGIPPARHRPAGPGLATGRSASQVRRGREGRGRATEETLRAVEATHHVARCGRGHRTARLR